MAQHFLRQINTREGLKTFYFNLFQDVDPTTYHVSVINQNKTHIFLMYWQQNEWIILSPEVEQWIISVESELSRTIQEHITGIFLNYEA